MRHFFTGILILLTAGTLLAQQTTPDSTGQTPARADLPKGNAKITGYVVDSTLTKAIEFANITLYTVPGNALVDGTVADDKGKFTLNRGWLRVRIKC